MLIIHPPILIGLYEVLGPISCSWHASHPPINTPRRGGGGGRGKEERDLTWNESFRENKTKTGANARGSLIKLTVILQNKNYCCENCIENEKSWVNFVEREE